MRSLNVDVLCHILENTSISNLTDTAKALVPSINSHDINMCERTRTNPVTYMNQLTKYGRDLLTVMGSLGVILSGSRAASYFYPGLCDETSDWDFYCYGTPTTIVRFSMYMSRIGVQWQTLRDDTGDPDYPSRRVLDGTLDTEKRKHSIQLIWEPRQWTRSPISHVLSFHSSIVQCFITGYCAVSMYDHTSSRNKSLAWVCDGDEKANECRKKYADRGVEYVPYNEYAKLIGAPLRGNPRIVQKEVRTLCDQQARVIGFSRYLRDASATEDATSDLVARTEWFHLGYTCGYTTESVLPKTSVSLDRTGCTGSTIETATEREWRQHTEEAGGNGTLYTSSAILAKVPWFGTTAVLDSIFWYGAGS